MIEGVKGLFLYAAVGGTKMECWEIIVLLGPMITMPAYLPKYDGSNDPVASLQLDLKQKQKRKIDEWISKNVPILVDVIQFDGQFDCAVFHGSHISDWNAWHKDVPSWKFNDDKDAEMLWRTRKARTLIIQYKSSIATLHIFILTTKGSGGEHKSNSYITTPYKWCDELQNKKGKILSSKIPMQKCT